jgi:acetyl esterase/lipase
MTIHREISYTPTPGLRTVGDLFLPDSPPTRDPVLLIHGGGWKGLAKEDFEFMVPFFIEDGRAVFNINYRLLGDATWPACGDDCLAAGRFLLEGGLAPWGLKDSSCVVVCGASAGGHLAMMTGLRLARDRVRGILSLAGPSRLDWVATTDGPLGLKERFFEQFFGSEIPLDDPAVIAASPALWGESNPPPLYCFHSGNDELVPPAHSEAALAAWHQGGSPAELTRFDGRGNLHGFWTDSDRSPGTVRPDLGEWVRHALSKLP